MWLQCKTKYFQTSAVRSKWSVNQIFYFVLQSLKNKCESSLSRVGRCPITQTPGECQVQRIFSRNALCRALVRSVRGKCKSRNYWNCLQQFGPEQKEKHNFLDPFSVLLPFLGWFRSRSKLQILGLVRNTVPKGLQNVQMSHFGSLCYGWENLSTSRLAIQKLKDVWWLPAFDCHLHKLCPVHILQTFPHPSVR